MDRVAFAFNRPQPLDTCIHNTYVLIRQKHHTLLVFFVVVSLSLSLSLTYVYTCVRIQYVPSSQAAAAYISSSVLCPRRSLSFFNGDGRTLRWNVRRVFESTAGRR